MPQGFSSWLQPKILSVEDDSVSIEVKVRPEMCNPIGTLHGGIHGAILDELAGMMVAIMGNETHFVSVNMTIDFLRVARSGETVVASCRTLKAGRNRIHIIGQLTDMDGKELSRAAVNMISNGMPMMKM